MCKPDITALSLSHSGGMELEKNYAYSVLKEDDVFLLSASLNSGNIEIDKEISEANFDGLVRLFDGVEIIACNHGDNDNAEVALDATTVSFTALFSDGTEREIYSLAHAPKEFREAADAFEILFRKMIEEVETNQNK